MFLAIMGIIGMLTTAYALSYPVYWVIDHTITPVLNYLQLKRIEWDAAYRD